MTLLWLLQECYSLASSFFKVQISRRFTVMWNIRARHRWKKVPSVEKRRWITCSGSMRRCVCGCRVRTKRQCGWDFVSVWVIFFFCCRLWMMETITTGCHAMQCITGACYRKFNLCYHAQYSQRRLIHIWWGWNGGVFCYKAVNGIWNANADRKL